jgi:hypothetical protein
MNPFIVFPSRVAPNTYHYQHKFREEVYGTVLVDHNQEVYEHINGQGAHLHKLPDTVVIELQNRGIIINDSMKAYLCS